MIIDTSALVAILFEEPERERFAKTIAAEKERRLAAAGFLELAMVLARKVGTQAVTECERFLRDSGIVVEPVTREHAILASQAFLDYGRGRHPAGLNFGDCFSYALAKATGEPLLFKGDDFSQTDVISAS